MFLKMAAGNVVDKISRGIVVDKNRRGCCHKIWSMSEKVYVSENLSRGGVVQITIKHSKGCS